MRRGSFYGEKKPYSGLYPVEDDYGDGWDDELLREPFLVGRPLEAPFPHEEVAQHSRMGSLPKVHREWDSEEDEEW
jgi:hypothetical protein